MSNLINIQFRSSHISVGWKRAEVAACCDFIKIPDVKTSFQKNNKLITIFPLQFLKTDTFKKEEDFVIEWIDIIRNDFNYPDVEYHGVEFPNEKSRTFKKVRGQYVVSFSYKNENRDYNKGDYMFKNHLIRMLYKVEVNNEGFCFKMNTIIKHFLSLKAFMLKHNIEYDPYYTFYFATLAYPKVVASAHFFPHFPKTLFKGIRNKAQVEAVPGRMYISGILALENSISTIYDAVTIKKIHKEYMDAKSQGNILFSAYIKQVIKNIKI